MLQVTKIFNFEAAHKLPMYEGECNKLHGHSYKLEVTVKLKSGCAMAFENEYDNDVPNLPATEYMVMDFKELSFIVKNKILKKVDHSYLNDFFDYPTAENMVYSFAKVLKENLPSDVVLVSMKLWETSTSYAEYLEKGYVKCQ